MYISSFNQSDVNKIKKSHNHTRRVDDPCRVAVLEKLRVLCCLADKSSPVIPPNPAASAETEHYPFL